MASCSTCGRKEKELKNFMIGGKYSGCGKKDIAGLLYYNQSGYLVCDRCVHEYRIPVGNFGFPVVYYDKTNKKVIREKETIKKAKKDRLYFDMDFGKFTKEKPGKPSSYYGRK